MDSGEKHLARASKGFQFWKCGQQEIQKCFNWDDVFKPLTLSIHLREKRNVLFLYHLLCPCPRPQLSNDANYNAGNSIRTRRRVWGKSWLLPPPIYNISHLPANIISPTFHTQSATPWKTFWRHQLWYYSRTRGRRRSVKLRHLFRLLARRRRPSGGFDPVIRSASKKEHLVAIFWQIYGRGCSSCHNSLWQTILIRSTPIDRVSPNKCFERRSPQLGRIILRGRSCVFLIIIRYFSFLR